MNVDYSEKRVTKGPNGTSIEIHRSGTISSEFMDGLLMVVILALILLLIALYILYSFSIYSIAKNSDFKLARLSWIPLLNLIMIPLLIKEGFNSNHGAALIFFYLIGIASIPVAIFTSELNYIYIFQLVGALYFFMLMNVINPEKSIQLAILVFISFGALTPFLLFLMRKKRLIH